MVKRIGVVAGLCASASSGIMLFDFDIQLPPPLLPYSYALLWNTCLCFTLLYCALLCYECSCY
jgi:hypothetical protein